MSTPNGKIDMLTLTAGVADGAIETVIVAFVDLQGRLMGKRVTGRFFVDHVIGEVDPAGVALGEGIEACDYLLCVDVDMNVLEGFEYSGWQGGYGDFRGQPDLSTLRVVPWLDRTALVLCDIVDKETGEPVAVSPRQILRRQIDRAAERGLVVKVGSELELFTYDATYEDLAEADYRTLSKSTSSWYNLDYHIFQSTKDEPLIGAIRRGMLEAGLPVEFSKGEAAPGQHELNLRYAEVLEMADNHTIYKNGAKEIAHLQGKALTFMAKPSIDQPGSSCHIHSSIWSADDDVALCPGDGQLGMSPMFRGWVAGQLAHARELSICFAPYINSYKRYQPDSWAPTTVVWSPDNRTAGFRLVGHGAGMRIESRVPGADCNPYIAFAAVIAAGLDGIDSELDCGDPFEGNGYTAEDVERIPWNLVDAISQFEGSEFAREAFGPMVHGHLLHSAKEEWKASNNLVSEWELRRNFERI
ncbi:MAG TPA: glutamine synthetase family protein [Microthrixaceae bacterium]|nr:glutamine synthetase family protein [Microthrixaceae bacterium]